MKTVHDVSILFVDDEPDLLSSLRRFLRKAPYQSHFAGSGREAFEILATQSVDIIVSDLRMPGMDGMSLLSKVKAAHPAIIRLVLSANRDVVQTIDAINTGEVYRYIAKPLNPAVFKGEEVPAAYNIAVPFRPTAPACRQSSSNYERALTLADEGVKLFNDGKTDEGMAKLGEAIELAPRNANIRYLRGQAHMELKQFVEACEDISAARELAPLAVFDTVLPFLCK